MPKTKNLIILVVILTAILAVLITLYSSPLPKTAQENAKALIGGPFSLVDHHGKSVTNEDFHGKYMLIYFGYTYCPDICPMELQIMSDALDQLPTTLLNQITPIFISVDPERDTVEVMGQYVQAFHPNLVGLTGTQAQINAVKKAYKVYSAKEKPENDDDPDGYLVSHSSYIYLMDRNGQYVTHFNSQTEPKLMAERLQEIIG